MAYQISFDLEENATQEFLSKVSKELPVEPIVEEEGDSTEEKKVNIKKKGGKERKCADIIRF